MSFDFVLCCPVANGLDVSLFPNWLNVLLLLVSICSVANGLDVLSFI